VSGLFDVSGRTALVTGGSRGIGLMIAEGLLRAGASVIITSRKTDELQATAWRSSATVMPSRVSTAISAR
jgi:NAD(P)-dependent dehydrogenase (short-subunit alcohol dehydrogenase family)